MQACSYQFGWRYLVPNEWRGIPTLGSMRYGTHTDASISRDIWSADDSIPAPGLVKHTRVHSATMDSWEEVEHRLALLLLLACKCKLFDWRLWPWILFALLSCMLEDTEEKSCWGTLGCSKVKFWGRICTLMYLSLLCCLMLEDESEHDFLGSANTDHILLSSIFIFIKDLFVSVWTFCLTVKCLAEI